LNHLAEAHAKLHFRKQVTIKDAIAAKDLFDMTYRNINTDSNGQLNPGRSEHKNRESLPYLVIRTIIEIGGGETGTRKASELSIVTELKKKGYDPDRVLGVIRTLMQEGRITEPKNGLYKVM
jgi:DNA replicative helicase MCM subunit Mcm2 (Cdc46/Mcm family)